MDESDFIEYRCARTNLNNSFSQMISSFYQYLYFSTNNSFDVRKKSPMGGGLEGQHWSAPNSFGGRAFFRAERNTSYLLITNVTSEVSYFTSIIPICDFSALIFL